MALRDKFGPTTGGDESQQLALADALRELARLFIVAHHDRVAVRILAEELDADAATIASFMLGDPAFDPPPDPE